MAESSSAQSSGGASSVDNPLAAFGANEWLVEEMYERYQQDPNSVDKAWWDFFKNYHGGDAGSAGAPNGATPPKTEAKEGASRPTEDAKAPKAEQAEKAAPKQADPVPAETPPVATGDGTVSTAPQAGQSNRSGASGVESTPAG